MFPNTNGNLTEFDSLNLEPSIAKLSLYGNKINYTNFHGLQNSTK